jgi:Tol biopolymer transport system component
MKKKSDSRITMIVLTIMIFSNFIYSQNGNIAIDYFGQTPPDTIPVIFAPGIICLENRFEARGAFSPDGKTFYFTITNEDFSFRKILFCEYSNNKWTKPDTASFSKSFNNHEPFFSFDGQKLFFTSDRDKRTKENKRDLFVVNKLKDGWSEPVKLDTPINSNYTEYFFCQSKKGTIYFASNRPGGNGVLDIYFINQETGKLNNIGTTINKGYTGDPCIAPDESYIIFTSARKLDADNVDLYISFNENGTWSEPVNMGNLINTNANEYSPFLSPDGKYLFFVRHDGKKGDIYWVNSSIINKYKNK